MHKKGSKVSREEIDKDILERGNQFKVRFQEMQQELKMVVIGVPMINSNGTVGAGLQLVDTKYRDENVSNTTANSGS